MADLHAFGGSRYGVEYVNRIVHRKTYTFSTDCPHTRLGFFVRGYSLKRGIVREQPNGTPGAGAGEATTVHEKDVERAANGEETTPTKE